MDAGDLQAYLINTRNNITTKTTCSTLKLAWAIANGLADIHHKGCIHRDLKSQNVLLSAKYYIKLAGLGLTRAVDTTMTPKTGTLNWTAPEVLKDDGQGHYNFPADICSFGVVLTELYTLDTLHSSLHSSQFLILNRVCDGSLHPILSDNCPSWYKS
ncbi:hypothetical protein THRCLA_03198 [Thraustotheca clavata]|uniref:Protein kinase domain-containing protein n=1 Tax=Thraustotheca clavata TaxID=74557 RepID=A0A1W0A2S3_9STRA|nr:hypothetical protein THRCLA_03198 [Thraustotheca clavata]